MKITNMKIFFDPKTNVGFTIRYAYKYDNTDAYGPINGEFYDYSTDVRIARETTLYCDTPHSYWSYTWVPIITVGGLISRTATVADFVRDKEDNGRWVPDALEKAWLSAMKVDSAALSPYCSNTYPFIEDSTGFEEVKNLLREKGYYPDAWHFLNIPMSDDCISKIDDIFEKYSKGQEV